VNHLSSQSEAGFEAACKRSIVAASNMSEIRDVAMVVDEDEEQLLLAIALSLLPQEAVGKEVAAGAVVEALEVAASRIVEVEVAEAVTDAKVATAEVEDDELRGASELSLHSPPASEIELSLEAILAALFTFLTEADLDQYGQVLVAQGVTCVDDLVEASNDDLSQIGFQKFELQRLHRLLRSRAEAGGDATGGSGAIGGGFSQDGGGISCGSGAGVGSVKIHAGGDTSSDVIHGAKNSSQDAAQCGEGAASAEAGRSRDDRVHFCETACSKRRGNLLINLI
jgi:hypothetical protein